MGRGKRARATPTAEESARVVEELARKYSVRPIEKQITKIKKEIENENEGKEEEEEEEEESREST